ncbi:hypothetical protein [Corallococcus sp. Z5C101001]|uniref:hypothetical protein n=1 Tax=Corallococcus sp. Z5C101001 TaxID=2596829 RepID=UPI00117C7C1E|nr:hypothetical protein [Corallococcus sp. Z5C101001]TSC31312.1 hypothetical protein FOF48_11560 [Corallococcus sp. Z5C101001]
MLGSALSVSPPPPDPRIPIAARDQAALEKYIGHCEALGRYQAQDVLVVRGYAGDLQLWVNPSYPGYRKAWVSAFGSVPAGHDVDHVYSKERGKQYGYGYVRLALVDGSINKGSGTFEKLMGQVHRENVMAGHVMQPPEIRYADDVQELKLRHVSFKPAQKYAENKKPGQAILGGTRLVGATKPAGSQVPRPTLPLTPPRNVVAVKPLVTPTAPRMLAPKQPLQVSAVTLHRTATEVRVVTAPRSHAWSGAVVGWLMGALVDAVNAKRMREAMDRLMAGVEKHLPKDGGALIAVVYEQPDNAASYNFSPELFLTVYVMGYGATAQEAYQQYQREISAPGHATLSAAAQKNWSKLERHVWVQAGER